MGVLSTFTALEITIQVYGLLNLTEETKKVYTNQLLMKMVNYDQKTNNSDLSY